MGYNPFVFIDLLFGCVIRWKVSLVVILGRNDVKSSKAALVNLGRSTAMHRTTVVGKCLKPAKGSVCRVRLKCFTCGYAPLTKDDLQRLANWMIARQRSNPKD